MKKILLLSGLLALIVLGGVGCGSGGATGQLSLNLGAASGSSSSSLAALSAAAGSPADVEAVFVTVESVQVHLSGDGEAEEEAGETTDDAEAHDDEGEEGEGGWITVAMPGETFNLMDLKNCLLEKLGSAKLPAGREVTQIRLVLSDTATEGHPFANYVVIAGVAQEIKVPSGSESGLKINPQGPVTIQSDGEVHVTLRIDLAKSLVFTGEGKIIFKPVVLASVGGETADANVSGHVSSTADGSAIAGAAIVANVANTDPAVVENDTATDADGNYSLCVAPGDYDVTASQTGFATATQRVSVSGGASATADFSLSPQ